MVHSLNRLHTSYLIQVSNVSSLIATVQEIAIDMCYIVMAMHSTLNAVGRVYISIVV